MFFFSLQPCINRSVYQIIFVQNSNVTFSWHVMKSKISRILLIYSCILFNPDWHEGWYFCLLVNFGSDFFKLIFYQNFTNFLEVKIDWVILIPCPTYWVFLKLPLGGAKDGHFYFLSKFMPIRVKSSLLFRNSEFDQNYHQNFISKSFKYCSNLLKKILKWNDFC